MQRRAFNRRAHPHVKKCCEVCPGWIDAFRALAEYNEAAGNQAGGRNDDEMRPSVFSFLSRRAFQNLCVRTFICTRFFAASHCLVRPPKKSIGQASTKEFFVLATLYTQRPPLVRAATLSKEYYFAIDRGIERSICTAEKKAGALHTKGRKPNNNKHSSRPGTRKAASCVKRSGENRRTSRDTALSDELVERVRGTVRASFIHRLLTLTAGRRERRRGPTWRGREFPSIVFKQWAFRYNLLLGALFPREIKR